MAALHSVRLAPLARRCTTNTTGAGAGRSAAVTPSIIDPGRVGRVGRLAGWSWLDRLEMVARWRWMGISPAQAGRRRPWERSVGWSGMLHLILNRPQCSETSPACPSAAASELRPLAPERSGSFVYLPGAIYEHRPDTRTHTGPTALLGPLK